jgi:hypothetical protein
VASFTTVEVAGEPARAVAALPAAAGIGHILGPERKSLVIGRPANLRRWAATHLGLGPPPAKGKRPPTNLAPIAIRVEFAPSTSSFHQRLLYERLMAQHVPRARRRDLKPAAFLHLDPAERFPRVTLRGETDPTDGAYGPFRDRKAAEKARAALHRAFPLRPCDYVFEPSPDLPLGLGCLFAQVRSCAAPCLLRVSEDAYRALAQGAAEALARAEARGADLGREVPAWVGAAGARGVVVARAGDALELYPAAAGAVLEHAAVRVTPDQLEAAVGALRFDPPSEPRDDRAWLLQALSGAKPQASFVPERAGEPRDLLAARVREVLR